MVGRQFLTDRKTQRSNHCTKPNYDRIKTKIIPTHIIMPIQYILMLICPLPKPIESLRKTNTNLPAHINIAYLKSNIDELKLATELSKVHPFDVKLDEVGADSNRVSITISRITPINLIITRIKDSIERKPQNSYSLTLINSKSTWTVYESESICKKLTDTIKLPVDVTINEIWLMKREDKKTWNVAQKIKLK